MHRVQGTFALSRLSDENRQKLINEWQELEGVTVRLDNKGLNATVECVSIDYNTLRNRYNEYIFAAKKAELEAQNVSTSHLPSAEFLAQQTEQAAQQAQEARAAVGGSLMANPSAMRGVQRGTRPRELNSEEARAKFGDAQQREDGQQRNLPANSPPPGMSDEGATEEYLQDEAQRRLNVPDGGQVNSGADPSAAYVPPQPEQPRVMESNEQQ